MNDHIGTQEEIEAALLDHYPAQSGPLMARLAPMVLPRHKLRRIVEEWRARHPRGGAPPGTGLTVERVVAAVLEGREPDGTWPTQTAVADGLGVTDRRVRAVVSPVGGWREILERAKRSG